MLDPSILVGTTPLHGANPAVVHDAHVAMEEAKEAEEKARHLSVAIEILSSLDETHDLVEASEQSVSLIRQCTGAERVIVLWRRGVEGNFSVVADNDDTSETNEISEHRLAIAAAEEVAVRNKTTHWPPTVNAERHALLAVGQFAQGLSLQRVVGVCLPDSSGHARGVVFVTNASDLAGSKTATFLSALSVPLARKLIAIERHQLTAIESAMRGLLAGVRSWRGVMLFAITAAFAVLMCLPFAYHVRADLELQPIQHRFVAVPFDGPLQFAHVRPGDVVNEGDLLAAINPREIEYQLASVRAELNRSLQEKKGLMAEHDFAGSRIAALESERLRNEADLLQYRRENLEIRSPITGVVVSGDLKQSEGMPMSRGETLFEIAPLGQMVVEIAVPESDVTYVRLGMPVDFYLHSMPSRTYVGTIARLHPRAELRDHDNVYVAEVLIRDPENLLRPGMRGRARIQGDRYPLGWNLFHKAWHAVLRSLGW